MSTSVRRVPLFFLTIAFGIVLSLPLFADAMGMMADAMCNPVKTECGCGQVMGPKGCTGGSNKFKCPCWDVTAGHTTMGACIAPNKCQDSADAGGLGQLGQILGQLLEKLMQPKPSSPSGGDSPSSSSFGTATCTLTSNIISSDASSTTAMLNWTSTNASSASITPTLGTVSPNGSAEVVVTAPTTYVLTLSGGGAEGATLGGSGFCSTLVPPVTSGLTNLFGDLSSPTTCSTLSSLLGTCKSPSETPAASSTNSNTNSNANTNQNNTTVNKIISATGTISNTGISLSAIGMPLLLAPGVSNGSNGDILFSNNGATIFGSSLNLVNNTGIAGFFGADTIGGGQPEGIVAGLCQNRPWAAGSSGGALSNSIFDGLCTARGYAVGAPPASAPIVPVVQLQQKPVYTKPAASPATSSPPAVVPKVRIWAVPASVPLATRSSIFWSTQGVTACTETSPDGSFNQNTLSGGAATAPLSGAMTFTISCKDAAGNPVTSYVTVNLSI